ncbi:MAG: HAD-IA family hydrolase [Candidatus Liptonbacteria bacterium]|nr:HAD-IA family hydrolase [Candidatus Liptonbacteria bacterium]
MNKKIKAVVFDYGGVIELENAGDFAGNFLGKIAEIVGVPADDFRNEYFKYNHLSNIKNMSWEDMIIEVVSKFTDSKEIKDRVLSFERESKSKRIINRELLDLFPILKSQGLKAGIFSNSNSQLREKLSATGIAKLVDEIVISGEIGFQKPHKEAFNVLFEKLGVRPGELVFIDDTPKSLEKADEIGYVPILFKNNEQLKTDLKNLGISTD